MSGNNAMRQEAFKDRNGNEILRTRCEIYTRVMGYYRPVSQFNNGKKSEFYSRTTFNEAISANSQFKTQFGNKEEAECETSGLCMK